MFYRHPCRSNRSGTLPEYFLQGESNISRPSEFLANAPMYRTGSTSVDHRNQQRVGESWHGSNRSGFAMWAPTERQRQKPLMVFVSHVLALSGLPEHPARPTKPAVSWRNEKLRERLPSAFNVATLNPSILHDPYFTDAYFTTNTGGPSTSIFGVIPKPGAVDAARRPCFRCGAPSAKSTVT